MTNAWPALALREWKDTYETLHLWTQIVGKIRMALFPPLNHWWHVTLYVNARGLTSGPIPYGDGVFEMQFDFVSHTFGITLMGGEGVYIPLFPQSVADFYEAVLNGLKELGMSVAINPQPQEIPGSVPFDQDHTHCAYDPEYAQRFWRILVSTSKVMQQFRGKFIGKCSPVHFFWGSFDLACTRFSGRKAPARKGAISGPAYSHEVCSIGFWPGGAGVEAAYYCYTIPQPAGLESALIKPEQAKWNAQFSEFFLMYEDVRTAESPEAALLSFFESTYEAGARLGKWDRESLEAIC